MDVPEEKIAKSTLWGIGPEYDQYSIPLTALSVSKTPPRTNRSTRSRRSNRSRKSNRSKQSKRSQTSEKNRETDVSMKEKFNKLDESAIIELEEVFGPRTEHNTPMLPNFITTLETVCNLGPFPTSILQALVKQGI